MFEGLLSRLLAQFFQRPDSGDFSLIDNGNSVTQRFYLRHDMRGENDGLAFVPATANKARNRAGGQNIETVGWLVEKENRRPVQDRAGDRHALFLPGRKFITAGVSEFVDVEFRENRFDTLRDFRGAAGRRVRRNT